MKIWTTKDGKKIRVCDLADSHLINILNMLNRKYNFTLRYIDPPCLNGEMAQMYAEHEWLVMIENEPSHLYPIYDALIEEASDRELNYE